jgi:exonuclease VII small subunit
MNNDQEPVFYYSKSNINNDKYTSLTEEITVEEVEEIINSMKNGKAPGNDSIPYEIFKNGFALMIKILTNIMNNCRIQNYTPKKWKEGRIWMIHKSDNHYEPGNFRPITLLRTSYKIYTKLLFKRLQKVVEKNNLLTNNQAGFRKS